MKSVGGAVPCTRQALRRARPLKVKIMNMNSNINWNVPDSKDLHVWQSPGWNDISKGLMSVAVGYLLLITLALPGMLLLCMIFHDGPLFHPRLVLDEHQKAILFLPIPIGLCGVVVLGFGLILAGKVRCLT